MNPQHCYALGIDAVRRNRSKLTNPYAYMTQAWAWWLAGWNDEDIKIGKRTRNNKTEVLL